MRGGLPARWRCLFAGGAVPVAVNERRFLRADLVLPRRDGAASSVPKLSRNINNGRSVCDSEFMESANGHDPSDT